MSATAAEKSRYIGSRSSRLPRSPAESIRHAASVNRRTALANLRPRRFRQFIDVILLERKCDVLRANRRIPDAAQIALLQHGAYGLRKLGHSASRPVVVVGSPSEVTGAAESLLPVTGVGAGFGAGGDYGFGRRCCCRLCRLRRIQRPVLSNNR